MEHHFPKLLGGDYIKGKAISVCMYMQLTSLIIQLFSHSLKRQKVLKPANKRVQQSIAFKCGIYFLKAYITTTS